MSRIAILNRRSWLRNGIAWSWERTSSAATRLSLSNDQLISVKRLDKISPTKLPLQLEETGVSCPLLTMPKRSQCFRVNLIHARKCVFITAFLSKLLNRSAGLHHWIKPNNEPNMHFYIYNASYLPVDSA